MDLNFEREAANASGVAPVSACQSWQTDSMEAAQTSIAAVYSTEADRLLRQAYRILHRHREVDIEALVQDAFLWALESWQEFNSLDHCRKALSVKVRNFCLHAIRASRSTVEADASLADPNSKPDTTKGTDATLAWLLDLCADETERRILAIWLQPGNQTAKAVSDATRHWIASWSPLEVNQLLRRLRAKAGVKLASARSLRFQTIGTMPGLHCESFRTLGSLVLIASGGRSETVTEALASRHIVPALRWDAVRGWVSGMEEVHSTR